MLNSPFSGQIEFLRRRRAGFLDEAVQQNDGFVFDKENGSGKPFLYRQGRWIDLTPHVDLSGTKLKSLYDAERINARGQIIGEAMGADVWHGYLLTPVGPVANQH